jgi:hypothetical protein
VPIRTALSRISLSPMTGVRPPRRRGRLYGAEITGAAVFGGGFQYSEGGGRIFSDPEARLGGQGDPEVRKAGTNAGASTRSEMASLSEILVSYFGHENL